MDTLNQYIQKLTNLVEQSKNKKLLWEEAQLISKKAFDFQDKIMAELDKIEALETDITKIQAAFAARETIWDLMNQITSRELELKEKSHHKETPEEREKRHADIHADMQEHHCCCHHHSDDCCCNHEQHECNCHHEGHHCTKGHKKCQKK